MTGRGFILWLLPAPLLALALTGCTSLPVDGPVDVGEAASPSSSAAPFDFNPPGPAEDASQEEIVAGFLRALQATPQSTRVASEFLTAEAASSWRPDRRTIVFGAQQSPVGFGVVRIVLDDVFELDQHGRWVGQVTAADDRELEFPLVREAGQWRISDPPDAMVIPRTHFEARYRQYSLYFFDHTGSILVPSPVHLPRGVQAPTLLVSGLLAGPSAAAGAVERSFLPRGTQLGVSVPVRDDRIAEIPLSAEVRDLTDEQLDRALAQLAWTLRQLNEVDGLRLTVDGDPVDLPDGRQAVGVGGWTEYSPAIAAASTDLFGLRGDAVVQLVGEQELTAAVLPSTVARSRSLGVDMTGARFALVPQDGRSVEILTRSRSENQTPANGYSGSDLLRPMWDRTDRLWVVDRTSAGTEIAVVERDGSRRLSIPGLDDRRVLAAALSRDGTRLTAVLADEPAPSLVVARVVRQHGGRPVRLIKARKVPTPEPLDRVLAVGWRDPATIAVLTRPSSSTSQVVLASTDGSSSSIPLEPADVLFAAGVSMATSPGGPTALIVQARSGALHGLDVQGRWDLDVAEPGLRAPAFVG